MVNPYYYIFYLLYILLNPIAKYKSRLPFSIISFMVIIFIVHAVLLLIILKIDFNVNILPKMNKLLFGGIFAVLYFTMNNYLFEKNDRYLKIISIIENAPAYKKFNSSIIICFYFLSPLIIKLMFS